MEKINLRACIAEAIGTFVLVFFACGVAIVVRDVFATALTFGLVIVIMSTLIGKVSGCHINPAVSLACLLTKRMSVRDFVSYSIAQIIGALLGAVALFGILKMGKPLMITNFVFAGSNHTFNSRLEAGPIFSALILETILTFIFVYVILHTTDEKHGLSKYAGLLIGVTLMFVHLIGINLTGTSVNPARSIGTAFGDLIFSGEAKALEQVWIFMIAPMGGGALAAVVYDMINKKNKLKEADEPKDNENNAPAEETVAE